MVANMSNYSDTRKKLCCCWRVLKEKKLVIFSRNFQELKLHFSFGGELKCPPPPPPGITKSWNLSRISTSVTFLLTPFFSLPFPHSQHFPSPDRCTVWSHPKTRASPDFVCDPMAMWFPTSNLRLLVIGRPVSWVDLAFLKMRAPRNVRMQTLFYHL